MIADSLNGYIAVVTTGLLGSWVIVGAVIAVRGLFLGLLTDVRS